MDFFCSFLCFFENRIFRWEWANRREKLMKAPYRIFLYPYKSQNDHFLFIFGDFLRTGFFIGNGLIDAKNWWKLPIGFVHILINPKSQFWAQSNVKKHPFFKVMKNRWFFGDLRNLDFCPFKKTIPVIFDSKKPMKTRAFC